MFYGIDLIVPVEEMVTCYPNALHVAHIYVFETEDARDEWVEAGHLHFVWEPPLDTQA